MENAPIGDEPRAPARSGLTGRSALIGIIVAAYAIFDFDDPVMLAVLAAAVFLNPLVVFVGAVLLILAFNLWACHWIDRQWDGWMAGERGHKIQAKLSKLRTGRFLRHPVRWVTSGSSFLFAFAATLLNPALVTVVARLLGGQRVGDRRILVASLTYAILSSLVFTAIGFGIGQAVS
jgi:hypothetical protein